MLVMKFGGTSVGNAEAIRRCAGIVRGRLDRRPVVVVSAMSKMTDLLYRIADAASAKNEAAAEACMEELRAKHISTAEELLEGNVDLMLQACSAVNEICDALERHVRAIAVLGELTPRSRALIVSNGELLSSTIISYAMNAEGIDIVWADARKMMITSGSAVCGDPEMEAISALVPQTINAAIEGHAAVITQGFIASTASGEPSVLGRGGSDYSASIIGAAMGAEAIEIWTDVDGVMTADPRMVASAKPISRLSFEETAEMAHFGAKVLHPMTIEPAVRRNIPIYVLNSMRPEAEGTVILPESEIEDGVKSVSYKENIQAISIFSTRMINVSGFLGKVFEVFGRHRVSADLISTSEATISVTVDGNQDMSEVIAELSEFAKVKVDTEKSQVSVIGKNLINVPGLLERIFQPVAGTRVYMVSQGASFINVSMVVDRTDLKASVTAIHNHLFS